MILWNAKGRATRPLDETDASGNLTNEYIFFGGKRIARRDSSSNVFYYFADHLGTSRAIVQAGQTSSCYDQDFYPYGREVPHGSEIPAFVNTCPQNYKFTGKERDSESGLDNFGARYDSSQYGRFMTPDVFYKDSHVGDPQSWNEYAYARNNPLRYVDPTGETATVSTNCTTDDQNKTTCNVSISASIAIYPASGSNLTQSQLSAAASTIQSSIQNAWSGSFTQDGVSYNVSTQVSVSVADSQSAAMNSGAQNVIGLSNGNASSTADSFVNPRVLSPGAGLRGVDTGIWNINNLANGIAAHEFTHLLGVDDRDSGAVLSNTHLLNDPSVPHSATASDFGWGLREATNSVNAVRTLGGWACCATATPSGGYSIQTRDTVHAPWLWWK